MSDETVAAVKEGLKARLPGFHVTTRLGEFGEIVADIYPDIKITWAVDPYLIEKHDVLDQVLDLQVPRLRRTFLEKATEISS